MLPKRLPHVITRADLAVLLAPTYAAAMRVDFDEAHERLVRALASNWLQQELYQGLSEALREARGPRSSEDEQIDKLSAGVEARRSRVRALPATPAISAVLVLANLEAGLAPEMMRGTLGSEKGATLLREGARALGTHILRELVK